MKQTKSRRAATKPEVRAKLAELKRDWKTLRRAQRAAAIQQLMVDEKMSYAGIGEAVDLSPSTIRLYKPPSTEQPAQKEGSGQRNQTSRLTAVIIAFLAGDCGAPEIPLKDRERVVREALIRFSSGRYDPVRLYLPVRASIAEVIKQTRPRTAASSLVGYSADWLVSILISMAPNRNERILALDDAATKIDFNWSQIRSLFGPGKVG